MALPLKQGWLYKYRNRFQGWKKYYFKLESSYLHYLESEFSAEPKGTTTRGEINRLMFTKDDDKSSHFGFEIHLKHGTIWYLRSETNHERMQWMRTLQPNAYFVDPLKAEYTTPPSAPMMSDEMLPHSSQSRSSSCQPISMNQQQQYETTHHGTPDSPPPAYDDIVY